MQTAAKATHKKGIKGFVHSAFSFFNESTIPRSNINGANVPHGALINFLQKGLLYAEMEAHVSEVVPNIRPLLISLSLLNSLSLS